MNRIYENVNRDGLSKGPGKGQFDGNLLIDFPQCCINSDLNLKLRPFRAIVWNNGSGVKRWNMCGKAMKQSLYLESLQIESM